MNSRYALDALAPENRQSRHVLLVEQLALIIADDQDYIGRDLRQDVPERRDRVLTSLLLRAPDLGGDMPVQFLGRSGLQQLAASMIEIGPPEKGSPNSARWPPYEGPTVSRSSGRSSRPDRPQSSPSFSPGIQADKGEQAPDAAADVRDVVGVRVLDQSGGLPGEGSSTSPGSHSTTSLGISVFKRRSSVSISIRGIIGAGPGSRTLLGDTIELASQPFLVRIAEVQGGEVLPAQQAAIRRSCNFF